jgi:diguanylate cyclase (GGDEF)-like protein/PAS domain S-box-containing protein
VSGSEVLDVLPQAYVAVDVQGTVIGWNIAAMALFGWSAQEALGTALVGLIVPVADRAAHEAGFRRAVAAGGLTHEGRALHVQAVRRDGSPVQVEVTIGVRADPAGVVTVHALIYDSDQRSKQDQLWLRTFADSPIGIGIVGSGGVFERVNAQFASILGRPGTDVVGMSYLDITHPDDRAATTADFLQLVTGEVDLLERVKAYLHADGHRRWVRRTASALRDPDGVATHFVVQLQDVTEAHTAAQAMERIAVTDTLTGLGNRRRLFDHVVERGTTFAVLMLDLDDFKRINDTLGHRTGDDVLIAVAQRLVAVCRPTDLVVRLGGDEFAVLLEGAGADDALAVCARLQEALTPVITSGGTSVRVYACIGAAVDPGDDKTIDVLLGEADLALYTCKAAGKRSTRLFHPSMRADSERVLALEIELRSALDTRTGLALAYQPVVDLGTGRVSGVEALCRWTHPRLGPIAPDEFIPVAEATGMIDELTTWVLTEACSTLVAASTTLASAATLTVAVNVACSTAEAPGFAPLVTKTLTAVGLAPHRLILEVTESGLARSEADLASSMWALHQAGVGFALDDFGTGYSSVARLAALPFTGLKLDRSFVTTITGPTDPAPVVHAAIALATGLGLALIAEGVETTEQRDYLATAGCGYAQGYLTGRPSTATDLLTLLRSEPPPTRPR